MSKESLAVLVVSSDNHCLQACSQTLSNRYLSIDLAANPRSAQTYLCKKPYDILILDQKSIDIYDLQLIAAMKSITEGKRMPVVGVMCQICPYKNEKWGEGNDCDEWLSFPVKTDELRQFIGSCISYHNNQVA